MRKHDGFIYYWWLSDLSKPDKDGDLSYKSYNQGDCKVFRFKQLRLTYHKGAMGGGNGYEFTTTRKWYYPAPKTVNELILKQVCSR